MKNDDLVRIFVGSEIEAGFISGLLRENGIECLTRNLYYEGLNAGWGAAMPGNGSEVYVTKSNKAAALEIINNRPEGE